VAVAAAIVLTPLVRSGARRWGFLDRPNERSSHTGVLPRAGIALTGFDPFASLLAGAAAGFFALRSAGAWWAAILLALAALSAEVFLVRARERRAEQAAAGA
jgi:UDP-N-acetylmuramyl pentapeptide phosphotransferase/UDP-N-acetylglucosamine-1-phosphate transferase